MNEQVIKEINLLFNDADITQNLNDAIMFWSEKCKCFFWLQKSYIESEKQGLDVWELVKEQGEKLGCKTLSFHII